MAKITFQGTPIHTSGEIPSLHSHAPEFYLIDSELQVQSLINFEGKKKLLNIVPSLDTPVCAQATKHFHEHTKDASDSIILTISADLPFAQKRFCQHEGIKTKTLSLMNNPQFGKDYGLLITDGPLKGLLARAVFVLDTRNTIIYQELVTEITQEPNYTEALKHL